MSTQPYESSQGLGTAPALANVDLGDEVPQTINPHDVQIEAVRWLVFAGSMIPPSQIKQRPDLRGGGEYFGQGYKTLVRSRGLLRRCMMTPLEPAYDFMSNDMIGDDVRLHVVTTVNHGGGPQGQLNGVQVYPGDEIKGILDGQRDVNAKGILELEQLRGVSYQEFKSSKLQDFIFPDWQKIVIGYEGAEIPFKMSELRSHLESRKAATQDESIRALIDVYLHSCDEFYDWGRGYLKTASQLVKMPASGGFVHTYSELAEQLFGMLEIRREDLLSKEQDLVDIMSKAQAGGNVSNTEVVALLAKMTDMFDKLSGNTAPPPVDSVPQNVGTGTIPYIGTATTSTGARDSSPISNVVEIPFALGTKVTLDGEDGVIREVKTAGWFAVETPSGIKTVRKDKLSVAATA